MKKKITPEVLCKVADLQKEGLSNTMIAMRLGFHISTLTQALRNAALGNIERSNKYGATKTICSAGHPHPSALECSVCEIHLLRERAKEIRNLKWQETVELAFGIKWKVDWSYEESPEWKMAFSEAKGAECRDYKLKVRMWKQGCGPGKLEIWKGTHRRPYIDKIIIPGEKK